MQKGDYILAGDGKKVYGIVGRWQERIVLVPTDDDDQVLIYGEAELERLISKGIIRKLHKTGIKVNQVGRDE